MRSRPAAGTRSRSRHGPGPNSLRRWNTCIEYAQEFAADPDCVGEAFASIDIQDVVDEGGPSIDVVFRALADAAFDCT